MATSPLPLPVQPAPRTCAPQKPRKSRMGRWRAAVLILVHVLILIHVAHWLWAGKTLAPFEPSEVIYMFDRGYVNIGAIVFGVGILTTLIFGRFFCGWTCHIIAIQDLCTWLLKKVGIRPKPFRSRLLILVPLGAALYMFAWPAFYRHVLAPYVYDVHIPPYRAHLTTEHFWETFPGPAVAIATVLVCTVAIVYLLGNKGFCTYACPYGGFFGAAEPFAPMRIRVTDACEQCGHCTSVCTSNVRVHEEVHSHGMVVNPGCMKCLDCVSVCPKGALYVGFGWPSAVAGAPRAAPKKREYDYSWGEELLMAGFFLATFFAVRGIYNAIPLLFSLGLAAISAYLLMHFVRTFIFANLRLHRWQLRRVGATTATGRVFQSLMVVWIAFLAHSGWIKWLRADGTDALNAGRRLYNQAAAMSPEAEAKLRDGLDLLLKTRKYSLLTSADLEQQIGSAYRYLGENDKARGHFERTVALEPFKSVAASYELALIERSAGGEKQAIEHLKRAVEYSPEFESGPEMLSELLIRCDPLAVVPLWERLAKRRPHESRFRLGLAAARLHSGDSDGAVRELEQTAKDLPDDAHPSLQLAIARMQQNALDEAAIVLRRIVERRPEVPEIFSLAANIHAARGNAAAAQRADAASSERAQAQGALQAAFQGAGPRKAREKLGFDARSDQASRLQEIFYCEFVGDDRAAERAREKIRAAAIEALGL